MVHFDLGWYENDHSKELRFETLKSNIFMHEACDKIVPGDKFSFMVKNILCKYEGNRMNIIEYG
jgi:hypothetical protein